MKTLVTTRGYAVVAGLFALTAGFWAITAPADGATGLGQFSQLIAALALVGFAATNFVSTRHSLNDTLFNGLDKAYIAHRWLGVLSLGLVFAHFITINVGPEPVSEPGAPSTDGDGTGLLSLVLFLILILLAVLAKKLKHERWKVVHAFMILPYAIGLVHYYKWTSYGGFSLTPLSLWLNLVNLVGVVSALYSVFLYERLGLRFRYVVSDVRAVSAGTVEITGTAIGRPLSFKPGQFAFVKLPGEDVRFPSHPFTMSGGTPDGTIQFTIKNLGDHTAALVDSVKTGQELVVSRAHGTFDHTTGSARQVWIAGGIGVTPFRSFYQSNLPEDTSVDFFYAYHGEQEGAYLDELRAMKNKNLRVHLVDDLEQGFLDVDKIKDKIDQDSPVDVYFCGPKSMRDSLKKDFVSSGIPVRGFHYEEFSFGR